MQSKNVEFMFVLPNTVTPDQNKGLYVIPGDIWSNKISQGTNRIMNPALLEPYKVQSQNIDANSQQVLAANAVPQ